MEKVNVTDLLNEVQQVKIMGGEQSNSELKIYLGHCRTYGDCKRFCHFEQY